MTGDWRSYPFSLVPGDSQLDFPAAEGEHPDQESDTWFIAALLLGPVLAWFASHPDSNLSELDAEIAALPAPPAASG